MTINRPDFKKQGSFPRDRCALCVRFMRLLQDVEDQVAEEDARSL